MPSEVMQGAGSPTRRRVLVGAPTLAALFLLGLRSEETAAETGAPEAVVAPPPAPEFGYEAEGADWWTTGFASRAEAVAAATCEGIVAFSTAEVTAYDVSYPCDVAGALVNAMLDGEHLGNAMASELAGSNGDGDFEGEFEDAVWCRDRTALGDAARTAMSAALRRIGRDDMAASVLSGDTKAAIELDDAACDALCGDATLRDEATAALRAYVELHDLSRELRGLMVSEVVEHAASPGRIVEPFSPDSPS